MINGKIVVGITQGDGNGIGYEVIIKALADTRMSDMFIPVIYGSSKLFGFYKKQLHDIEQLNTNLVASAKDAYPKRINIVNCLPDNVFVEPGKATPESAKSAMKSLETAVDELKAGFIDCLVTAPINKRAMVNEGFGYTGHTEYLVKEFNAENAIMIMCSDRLKVGVVIGHIPLSEVPGAITEDGIVEKLHAMNSSLERDFGILSPKIAVLGLNPHCGDGGLLGHEEQNIILPAVLRAQKEGINAYGPYSPDGFFSLGNYSRFDATLAMYHDQGLIPFKALSFEVGVNFTAGLPVVRTSPDHGTAYEMAGKDMADPQSMKSAIYMAIDIFNNRLSYDKLMENRLVEEKKEEDERPSNKPQIA